MSFWHPKRAVPLLSKLVVDTDKDWLGYIIKNLGGIQIPRTDDPATLLEGLMWYRKDADEWKYSPDGSNIKSLTVESITRVSIDAEKSVSVYSEMTSGTHWSSEVTVFEGKLYAIGSLLNVLTSGVLRAKLHLGHAPETGTYATAYLRIYVNDTKILEQTCTRYGGYSPGDYINDCTLSSVSDVDISNYSDPPTIKITLQVKLYAQYDTIIYGYAILPAGDIFDFVVRKATPFHIYSVT